MMKRLLLTVALLLTLSTPLWAAPTLQGTPATQNGEGVTSLSWTYDSGASGSNCITLIGVAFRSTTDIITSVTHNSQAFTLKQFFVRTDGNVAGSLWYLLSPPRGSFTAQVNFSGSANASAGAVTYCDVNLSTPFGTVVTGEGSADSSSIVVSSASGELVIDLLSRASQEDMNVGASQTERISVFSPPADATARALFMSEEAGAASVTMSWSGGLSALTFIHIGVPLKPVEGGGGGGGGATRFVDVNLVSNCLTGNYSIAARDCTGTDGDAYTGSQANINTAVAATLSGESLAFRAGTYAGITLNTATTTFNSGSSYTNAPVFKRHASETVTFTYSGSTGGITIGNSKQFLIFDGFIVDGTNCTTCTELVWVGDSANHIRFKNMEVKENNQAGGQGLLVQVNSTASDVEFIGGDYHDATAYCFYISGARTLIERLKCHDVDRYGVHVYSGTPNDSIIRYIEIFNTGTNLTFTSAALLLTTGSNILAHHNVIRENTQYGVQIGGTGVQLYNNTITKNAAAGGGYSGVQLNDSTNAIIKNNIIYDNDVANFEFNIHTNTTFAKNHCETVQTGCSQTGDPNFINAAGDDYRLSETSTALINAGEDISGFSPGRFCGSKPDIGAYEAPCFSNGSVEAGEANKAVVNISIPSQGIDGTTGLQACTATDFIVAVAGGDRLSTTCDVVDSDTIKVTFDGLAVTQGQTLTIRYTRGTLTDNLSIGGVAAGDAKILTFSAQALSNNVSGQGGGPGTAQRPYVIIIFP